MKLSTIRLDKSRTLNGKTGRDEFIKVSASMTFDLTEHDENSMTLEECYEQIGTQVSTLMNGEARKLYNQIKGE